MLASPSASAAAALAWVGSAQGRWSPEEHSHFLCGLELHGRDWSKIKEVLPQRTIVQIRTHAQKYFLRCDSVVRGAAGQGIAGESSLSSCSDNGSLLRRISDSTRSIASGGGGGGNLFGGETDETRTTSGVASRIPSPLSPLEYDDIVANATGISVTAGAELSAALSLSNAGGLLHESLFQSHSTSSLMLHSSLSSTGTVRVKARRGSRSQSISSLTDLQLGISSDDDEVTNFLCAGFESGPEDIVEIDLDLLALQGGSNSLLASPARRIAATSSNPSPLLSGRKRLGSGTFATGPSLPTAAALEQHGLTPTSRESAFFALTQIDEQRELPILSCGGAMLLSGRGAQVPPTPLDVLFSLPSAAEPPPPPLTRPFRTLFMTLNTTAAF